MNLRPYATPIAIIIVMAFVFAIGLLIGCSSCAC